jgi:hypothetical protein
VRYGPIAETAFEGRFLNSSAGCRPQLDVCLATIQARALMAGSKLGVFDSLRSGARCVAEIPSPRR